MGNLEVGDKIKSNSRKGIGVVQAITPRTIKIKWPKSTQTIRFYKNEWDWSDYDYEKV